MSRHSTPRRARRIAPVFVSIGALALCAQGNHGPGTSGGGANTAAGETLKQGTWEFGLRTDYTQYQQFSVAEAADQATQNGDFDALSRAWLETLSVGYGVTDDLQLNAQIGYYWGIDFLEAEPDGMGGAEVADADPQGLTDLWIDAKYRLMHGPQGHLAAIAGVKLPTGKDDELLSNGELLEPSSQPGTGAFDGQLGLAYSRYLTSRLTADASAFYTFRGEHDGFRVGDRADFGLDLAYRLTEDVQAFPNWSIAAEAFGNWLGMDDDDGTRNENSGGTTVFVSPVARVRFDSHVALSLAPAFPVIQDLNGDQDETEFKLALTLSFTI